MASLALSESYSIHEIILLFGSQKSELAFGKNSLENDRQSAFTPGSNPPIIAFNRLQTNTSFENTFH